MCVYAIVSIVFVGIFSMLAQIAIRSIYYSSRARSSNSQKRFINVDSDCSRVAVVAIFASLMRFAISRKREYT